MIVAKWGERGNEASFRETYNLAFFLGPGFPLGFGSPSGPNETPEALFIPFFLIPSVGGGINDGTGVPFGMGVVVVVVVLSTGFSADVLGAVVGIVLESVEDESFEGVSSLTSCASCCAGAAASNLCRALDDSCNVMIIAPFDDFRRAVEGIAGLLDGAIVD
jgi:hypothetical protein